MTLAFAGLLAGFVHVLSGPDHLAAIAPYAVDRKRKAWRTGVRWRLGHTTGVLGVAVMALLLRHALPIEHLSLWGERCVGLVLIAIGIWGVRAALAARTDSAQHTGHRHAHSHEHDQRNDGGRGAVTTRRQSRAAFAVGTLHGLAGSSHLLGVLPALAMPSDFAAGIYLVLFGMSSVAGMGTFASFVGWIAGFPSARGVKTQAALFGMCSVVAVAVGGFWIVSDAWFISRLQ